MENKYNLAKLHYDKEKVEELITRHTQRVGQPFPKKMEQEFWSKNLERARKHIVKYLWAGVLSYFVFMIVMMATDYWVVDRQYFVVDYVQCVVGLANGGLSLLLLYFFASHKTLQPYFLYGAIGIFFWVTLSMACLTITVRTQAFQQQALSIICIVYILGYLITGVRPLYMLISGFLGALATIMVLFAIYAHFNALVISRILIGSCLLGYVISHMIFARERMIFLYSMRAKISEQIHRIYNTELLHLSQHDELTNISNRRTFDEMLEHFYSHAHREQVPLAVLFIDVDHFKFYNDFYGHQKGDKVISSIAKTIKSSIRHMDFVARYGGEEFVVLLPETDAHGAYAVASNIYKAIDRLEIPHAKSLVASHVTISLGITVYRGENTVGKEELLSIADQALYRAKQLGRNQIYYQSIRSVNVA